jgi:hypothetical protein
MKFGNDLFIIVCIIVPLIWKKPYSQSKLNQYIIVRGSRFEGVYEWCYNYLMQVKCIVRGSREKNTYMFFNEIVQ